MGTFLKNNVNNKFNRMLTYNFIISGLIIVLGLVLLFLPEATNKLVGIIAGISFLITGASTIFKYFHRDGAKLYGLNLIFGIIYGILGLLIVIYPFSVVSFINICLGLYMIVRGCMKINYAYWLKRGGHDSWIITLVTGIMFILFGIMVAFNPFVGLTITRLVGIFLIISAILDITDTILFKQRAKEITDIFW